MNQVAKTEKPRNLPKPRKQPKERTSVFLDSGSLELAASIAAAQTKANPTRDKVNVSAVLREANAIGLDVLAKQHLPQPAH